MFKKPFDFSLFTTSLGPTSIAREADIERRRLERILLDDASNKDTQDIYIWSRQPTRDS